MAADAHDGMDAVTEELYALDPGDFVTARNELVKRLKKAGDKQLAAEVGKLRRPTPAAWAVNQLARRHRGELEDLVRRGKELRAAQDRALAGAEAGDLRQAGRARRDAVARLVELAEGILGERGAAYSGEVAATLEAASLDAEAGAAVLGGRLSSELQPPSGFGAFDLTVAERRAPPRRPEQAAEPEKDGRAREEAREAAAEARRRWEEVSEKARAAVEKVDQRRKAVRQAEAEVARLEDLLADAERKLRAAVRETEQAEDAASRAEDAAARATERLRAAEERVAELGGA
ncbi:MAG TPA: hypothetical protein VHF27_08070 [Acidimicrobiales bacterium]|nr:hypothetical protein [Acidimicrobiales bacterium]